jgi:Fe-S-cluster containining protein
VRVPLTHFDLARLVAATTLRPEELGEWLAPDEVDMAGEPGSFVELNIGRRLLVLRHGSDGCRFLSSEGLCEAYAARPITCAAYPYSVECRGGTNAVVVLGDAPCSKEVAERQLANAGRVAQAQAAAECVQSELLAYWNLVEQWNRQQRRRRLAGRGPRSEADYFEYLWSAQLQRGMTAL